VRRPRPVDRPQAERDAIVTERANATGLGGRRRNAGSTHEGARVAATKAIAAAIDRLTRVDPALGAHLSATVHTGGECRYSPDPADAPEWILS
jgi:hypothetical protein